MELLCDVGHVESSSVRLDMVLLLVQDRCTVCAKRTVGLDIVFNAPMVLLDNEAQVEARFSPFGDSANLVADRCTVCTERTIGSEIIFTHAM